MEFGILHEIPSLSGGSDADSFAAAFDVVDGAEAGAASAPIGVWTMGMSGIILPCPQVQIPGGLVSHLHWHGEQQPARPMTSRHAQNNRVGKSWLHFTAGIGVGSLP